MDKGVVSRAWLSAFGRRGAAVRGFLLGFLALALAAGLAGGSGGCQSNREGLGPLPMPDPAKPDPTPQPDPDPPLPVPEMDAGVVDVAPAPDTARTPDAYSFERPASIGGCNFGYFIAERVTPEIMLLFDRSSAMRKPVAGTPNSRWVEMTNGVADALAKRRAGIAWGLKFFPSSTACLVDEGVDVPVGPMQLDQVINKIRGGQPTMGAEGAPLHQAIINALRAFPRSGNPRYFILASDGQAGCPHSDAAAARAYDAVDDAAQQGVWTFVVGTPTANMPQFNTVLNELARTGREGRPAPNRYLPASNKAEMMSALDSIADQLASCVFATTAPPAPNNVAMDIEGVGRVPRDPNHLEGWDYGPDIRPGGRDMRSLRVFGSACARLRQNPALTVQMTFGCPGISPP